ncbi:MAG: fatty acid desaturase family protein [Bacteriovoracaceae bacterium]
MTIFRHKADQLPITLILCLFTMDVLFYFVLDTWSIVAWFVASTWFKANICAWNHHHQHCVTFRSVFLNRLLEIVFGFHTGITTKGWLLHHVLGHHQNYLDQTKDESRWMNEDGTTKSEAWYTIEVAGTSFYRIIKVGLNHPRHLRDFLLMFGLQMSLLGVMFWHNWFNALFVFFLPMVIGLTLTAWATYDHHSNLDTKNEYEGSRNTLDPFYNMMTGNLGYHTAHHVKHSLHWSKVPALHASIEKHIPEHCYLEVGAPYSWVNAAKKMLRKPSAV